MDLIIRNIRLADRGSAEPVDIGVEGGGIVAIERGLTADGDVYEGDGRLACAGLVETHIHLDKSRIIDRFPPPDEREFSPVKQVAPAKPSWTVEDVHERAARTLERCILNGATRMRTQVEVDPGIGLRGFEAIHSLIAEYRWAIDIEMCVFPQEGLISYPGTDALLVQALKRGARVIGGAPRYDTDARGQLQRVFELAREFDADIDLHLDVGNTPDEMLIHFVCELTEQMGRQGRVVVGHMTKLALLPPAEVRQIARKLSDLGIAVTVLPATELYLMGRDRDHAVRRGVADLHLLLGEGVNCSISTNNVLNPATPYGDCSLIRMANLHANLLQVGQARQLRQCFEMVTERSARLLRLSDYGLAVGNPADVVVIDAETPEQAIAEIAAPVAAFKRGRRTVIRHPPELVRP